MIYNVLMGTLNPTHSLTHSLVCTLIPLDIERQNRHVEQGRISRGQPRPNTWKDGVPASPFLGTSYTYIHAHYMRNSNQILVIKPDDRKFLQGRSRSLAWPEIFEILILVGDLFAVANFFVSVILHATSYLLNKVGLILLVNKLIGLGYFFSYFCTL